MLNDTLFVLTIAFGVVATIGAGLWIVALITRITYGKPDVKEGS